MNRQNSTMMNRQIQKTAIKAADRLEKYKFKKSSDYQLFISEEMKETLRLKFELYENKASKWQDRHSIIAAPLGVDSYLQCERAMPAIILGAPRYYADDYVKYNHEPESNKRFPYSDEAQTAAKRITFALHQRVLRRHRAARIIQRKYRNYKNKILYKAKIRELQSHAKLITRFVINRKHRLKSRNFEIMKRNMSCIKIQSLWRGALIRMSMPKIKAEILSHISKKLEIQTSRDIKAKRKLRGELRRNVLHATRLQAFFRGHRVRLHVQAQEQIARDKEIEIINNKKIFFSSENIISKIFCIMKALRKYILYKRVLIIQRNVRMFIGKRRAHRRRLVTISEERSRFTKELIELQYAVTDFVKMENKSWCGGLVLRTVLPVSNTSAGDDSDVITLRIMISSLDKMSSAILRGMYSTGTVSRDVLDLDISSLSYRKRVALAILCLYSNRPNACIDSTSLEYCLQYFTIVTKEQNFEYSKNNKIKILKYLFELQKNNFSTTSLRITCLLDCLQPHRSIVWRSRVLGHLSDDIVISACVVRQWTTQLDKVLRKAVMEFRMKFKVKNYCTSCLEPLIWQYQVREHCVRDVQDAHVRVPLGCLQCVHNAALVWVNKDITKPAKTALSTVLSHSLDPEVRIDRTHLEYSQIPVFQIS